MKRPHKSAARAAATSDPVYPRPQLQREKWGSLDGRWDFSIDAEAAFTRPEEVAFDRTILVPFAPETPKSGVHETGFYKAVWYRRTFAAPRLSAGERLILHFGAVDYAATVWVNGRRAAQHEGGYTPFSADVTDLLDGDEAEQTIIVRAFDDPHDLAKPRGKQDWQLEPHSIWYYRTTGIWQHVWWEVVPATRVQRLRWSADPDKWEIALSLRLSVGGALRPRVRVTLTMGQDVLADDTYQATGDALERVIRLADPGIDDARARLLWSPHAPNLIDARIRVMDEAGDVVDDVRSYTAMRSVRILGDRFCLNGKPYPLHLVLDQGYWPQSGLSAPDDAALKRDVELARAMGFNGVRKHQKIEDPRYLYWADRIGLLVWEEMPGTYQFSDRALARATTQWMEAVERDASHPCIVAWMPFNESWGVPDLPVSAAQRAAVAALYHLTKSLDPSRPVIGNDGWEHSVTDILGIHDYDPRAERLRQRYCQPVETLLARERPGYRVLLLDGFVYQGQPVMLTEFGGIAFSKHDAGTWGYSRARTPEQLARHYASLCDAVRAAPLLSGFCYTQFTDTYQEANGLLYMDRAPKFPLAEMAVATRGPRNEKETELMETWRAHFKVKAAGERE